MAALAAALALELAVGTGAAAESAGSEVGGSPRPVDARFGGPGIVIDGDTVTVSERRVRLFGIDAPELAQQCTGASGAAWNCGRAAATALGARIGNQPLECHARDIDRYGRVVAVCRAGSIDLGRWMVAEGWALAYRSYSLDYVPQEQSARRRHSNLWQGSFEAPWAWRAARRREAEAGLPAPAATPTDPAAPAECTIKGNINSRGERIYHLPSSPSYATTRIDESRGERWFCSQEDARAAGWRLPGGSR